MNSLNAQFCRLKTHGSHLGLYPSCLKDFLKLTGYFSSHKLLCALDIGTSKCGIALSDNAKFHSIPYAVVPSKSVYSTLDSMTGKISGLVIGLPLTEKGKMGAAAERTFQIITKSGIMDLTLPIWFQDESFTTAWAINNRNLYSRKRNYDSISAMVILDDFLYACRAQESESFEPMLGATSHDPVD